LPVISHGSPPGPCGKATRCKRPWQALTAVGALAGPLQAFANVLRRALEAAGRGMWSPSAEQLERLRGLYGEMDEQLEGVSSK
jgi:hypothetical protein